MTTAIFYSGTRNASSWAMRGWLALRAAAVPFDEVIVDIRRPQRFANLARIAEISPSATVPALAIDGRTIFDSIAIMEFANDVAGGRLLPADTLDRAAARSLMAWQHAGLSGICARISFESAFYPYKRALTDAEQREAARLFAALEPLLARLGGPFLFGAATLADFMLAPTAVRLARHQVGTHSFPLAADWLAAVLAQELVAEWLADADRAPHIRYDEYLVPGAPRQLYRDERGAEAEKARETAA
jgi:glutathione S-transferase